MWGSQLLAHRRLRRTVVFFFFFFFLDLDLVLRFNTTHHIVSLEVNRLHEARRRRRVEDGLGAREVLERDPRGVKDLRPRPREPLVIQ